MGSSLRKNQYKPKHSVDSAQPVRKQRPSTKARLHKQGSTTKDVATPSQSGSVSRPLTGSAKSEPIETEAERKQRPSTKSKLQAAKQDSTAQDEAISPGSEGVLQPHRSESETDGATSKLIGAESIMVDDRIDGNKSNNLYLLEKHVTTVDSRFAERENEESGDISSNPADIGVQSMQNESIEPIDKSLNAGHQNKTESDRTGNGGKYTEYSLERAVRTTSNEYVLEKDIQRNTVVLTEPSVIESIESQQSSDSITKEKSPSDRVSKNNEYSLETGVRDSKEYLVKRQQEEIMSHDLNEEVAEGQCRPTVISDQDREIINELSVSETKVNVDNDSLLSTYIEALHTDDINDNTSVKQDTEEAFCNEGSVEMPDHMAVNRSDRNQEQDAATSADECYLSVEKIEKAESDDDYCKSSNLHRAETESYNTENDSKIQPTVSDDEEYLSPDSQHENQLNPDGQTVQSKAPLSDSDEDRLEMLLPKDFPPIERRYSQTASRRKNSNRMRYKVRSTVDDNVQPPVPPRRNLNQKERDNAPGISRREDRNSLSMVLPLSPPKRLPSRRAPEAPRHSPEIPDAHSSNLASSEGPASSTDGVNSLPLPPKPKHLSLPRDMEASSSIRRYGKNPARRGLQRGGSIHVSSDTASPLDLRVPRRPQTMHRDQFEKEEEAQFLPLLDIPLKHKGSVASQKMLTEKNVHDFLMAAKKGETDRVKTLLMKLNIDINVSDQDKMTALHYACRSGNPDTVALLVDRGACINARTVYGSEPLMIALREKPQIETARKWHQQDVAKVVHSLVCAGASVHSVDPNGLSTLLVATSVENNYSMDYLLDNGADPNWPLALRSLLHIISIQVSRGVAWIEIEKKMLENGANPNIVDCCGNTPASLLFYSEFTPLDESDMPESGLSGDHLDYETYMDLPAVLRLAKPNKNTFGYTRKRLNRLLRHLKAGLDLNKMPMEMMLQLDKFLLREQHEEVLRLFHACGHYPSVAMLQTYVPNQVTNYEELWEVLESPTTLMLSAASVVRANTRTSAHLYASHLPLPKSIIPYVSLEAYEDVFKQIQHM